MADPEQPDEESSFPDEETHADRDPAAAELVEADVPSPVEEAEVLAQAPEPAEFPEEATHPGGAPELAEDVRALHLQSIIESLIFVADKPLSLQVLGQLLGENDLGAVRAAVAAIEAHYAPRGLQLHSVAGGYQLRSNPANAAWVQKLLAQKPVRLSRALLETLAIVSYRQPITRPEIDDIRGVDSGATLKTLMDRSLVRILGKKEEPGRPMLYGTTRDFLEFFNLSDLKDLPTLREFHELSDEHRAQVEALEAAAPAGSIESGEETPEPDAAAQQNVLRRVEFKAPPEDSAELEEIDRLIRTAHTDVPMSDGDPLPESPPAAAPPPPDAKSE
jgi:segregation and condensation protein B